MAVVVTDDDSDGWYDPVAGPIVNHSQTTLDAAICNGAAPALGPHAAGSLSSSPPALTGPAPTAARGEPALPRDRRGCPVGTSVPLCPRIEGAAPRKTLIFQRIPFRYQTCQGVLPWRAPHQAPRGVRRRWRRTRLRSHSGFARLPTSRAPKSCRASGWLAIAAARARSTSS